MGDFPFLSAEPELEESSVLLAVVMCTQPLDAELPRTFSCTDVGVFFVLKMMNSRDHKS